MTIANQITRLQVAGNGITTQFAYTFPVPAQAQSSLYITAPDGSVALISQSAWRLNNPGSPTGGTFDFPLVGSPVPSGYVLTLVRQVPFTQPTNLANQGAYYPRVVEAALDNLTMQVQQLASRLGGTLRLTDADTDGFATMLPKENFANRLLGFDANGNPVPVEGGLDTLPATPFMADMLLSANAADALGNLGVSPFMTGVLGDADADAVLGNLGVSPFMTGVLGDADADAVLDDLGATAVGKALLTAGDVGAALALLGLNDGPGRMAEWARNTPPPGWLKANGAEVSRTTYAALFAAIGTTWGAGDGATTFNVPDARGVFSRGWDDGRGVDEGRAFGSSQLDAFQGHLHAPRAPQTAFWGNNAATGSGGPTGGAFAVGVSTGSPVSDGTNGTPRTATETRPRNLAYLVCIKY